jgi:hypothetical protein
MVRAAFGTGHFLVGALFVLFGLGVFTGDAACQRMLLGEAEQDRAAWFPARYADCDSGRALM